VAAVEGRPATWLDVFTDTPLTGNGLAVIHEADGLDDATMLAVARETRLSETTFVQPATAAGADYRNRIFSPPGEMAFAGHPSLGTAVAVAHARGERSARYVQQTHAGLQPVEVSLDGDRARASMLQEPPVAGAEAGAAPAMAAAGLAEAAAHPRLTPQVVSTGLAHLLAPVRDAAVLADCAPTADALRALLEPLGAVVLYRAAVDPDAGTARARSFLVDRSTVLEDPATGSAAGPLLAYLHERLGLEALDVRQGVEMGRPSRIETAWAQDRPRVSGDVVIVADARVRLG
jgi:trans-2,3-dihydro-3-hydroxyanthranilate isomerase